MDYHPKDMMYGFHVVCIVTVVISIIAVTTNMITIVTVIIIDTLSLQ